MRLASQLIGWQIDLYGSREWLERATDMSVFSSPTEDQYETADFPLSELSLPASTLGALSTVGYETFLQIIDLERRDFLGVEGLGEEDADRLLQLIDELTVVESDVVVAEMAEDGTLGDDQENDQDQTDEQTVENDQGPATKSEKEDGEVE